MNKQEWDTIASESAAGQLSDEQMKVAIAKADRIIKFIRQQVRYGRATETWQRAALDNIQQEIQ